MTRMVEREKRVPLHLPLQARGEDAAGVAFSESTRSLNISGGGILFESHRHLLVGTRLTLAIQLPEPLRGRFGGKPIYRVRSVVCRVERFAGEAGSRIGARFLGEA